MRHRMILVAVAAALAFLPGAVSAQTPTVGAISPTTGSTAGGTLVTITGSGFTAGTRVLFGGTPAPQVTVSSANVLVATTPAGAAGNVAVVVINLDGTAGATQFQYQTTAQTGSVSITSLNPIPSPGGSTTVYISGSGFVNGALVTLGGVSVGSGGVISPTLIVAVAPAGVNADTATVTNVDGSFASYPTGTTPGAVPAPSATQPVVTAVQPPSGSPAGGTAVSISGTGFLAGATVSFGGVPASAVTVVSPTLITAIAPPNPAGPATVLVASPTGAVGGLSSAFTYAVVAPVLSGLSPNGGPATGGTTVALTGAGFVAGATVTFGGQAASNVTIFSPTQIVAVAPPGVPGAAVVLVTNPGGLISGLATGFTYTAAATVPPPTSPTGAGIAVTGVSPASGPSGTPTLITINGQGFLAGAIVTVGGVPATNVTVISPVLILASVPTSPPAGPATVVVSNAGGAGAALPGGFTYTAGTPTPAPNPVVRASTFPAGGSGLFVFPGGSNSALVAASGCPAGRVVFWATDSKGQWVGYIPTAPAVINITWDALFPNGLPAGIPIFVKCSP